MNILEIDGGGLRGAFSAAIIKQMELKAFDGNPASTFFNCFYGTSTGSIIAAALATQMSAGKIEQFYRDKADDCFERLPFYNIIKANLFYSYSKEHLEEELKEIFGDTKIFDVDRYLCIPVKDTETGYTLFYNNFNKTVRDHKEKNLPLWKIIRMSTAAPTFFPPEGNRFIDGGISAYNNASYAAYVGAVENLGLDGPPRIYSVGTGYHVPTIKAGDLEKTTKIGMANYIIDQLMEDINLLQNSIMKRLEKEGKCWYKRYNIQFSHESFAMFGIPSIGVDFNAFSQIDNAGYVPKLIELGELVGKALVDKKDFPC